MVIDAETKSLFDNVLNMLTQLHQHGVADEIGERKEFPYYLPNGQDVTTVGQVAALMGVSKAVAALYVLETDGLATGLYREAKSLLPAPPDDQNGVAIMLYPSRNDAEQIAYGGDGGNDWSQLHITLLYFGTTDQAPPEAELKELTSRIALTMLPFTVTLNGITRFTAPKNENDPLVINCDSPQLELLRRKALDLCGELNLKPILNHGYSPHMTLGYVEQDQPTPIDRWIARDIKVSDLVLGYGTNYTHFLMGTETTYTKDVFTGSAPAQSTSGITTRPIVARARMMQRRKRKLKKPPLS